ncbi:MAG TPA: zinc-dependent peptidase [Rubrivivax sp.]|nr:zinc-dependent peptidase [Rubrivivax sp.]
MNGNELQAAWPLAGLAALLGAGGAALVLLPPWWTRWRHRRLRRRPFPRAWARILRQRVPLAQRLPAPLQQRLRELIQVFIADKPFIGCGGQAIDDQIRVTVAAHACLLLLGQPHDACYPRLRQVLVYPDAFVVPRRRLLPGGVVSEEPQLLAGESWAQGQVVLAWAQVLAGAADPDDGRNVALHEFAHQIDQDGGDADGHPWQRDAATRRRWAAAVADGLARLREPAPDASETFDAYGATDPAEFFAVATEAFFERPAAVAEAAPALYDALSRLYRLDPCAFAAASAARTD